MSINNEACPEFIGGELLPNIVRMSGDNGMRTVAEVCG